MNPQPVAIITAAGSGIGAGCARVIAVRGYRVVLMSRTEAATGVAQELGGIGFQSSLISDADLQNLVAVAIGEYHRIHAVINSTGHASGSTGYSDERLDHSGGGWRWGDREYFGFGPLLSQTMRTLLHQ